MGVGARGGGLKIENREKLPQIVAVRPGKFYVSGGLMVHSIRVRFLT